MVVGCGIFDIYVGSLEPSLEENLSKWQERLGVDGKEGLLNVLCLVPWAFDYGCTINR